MVRLTILLATLAVSCSGGERSKAEEPAENEVVEQPAEPPELPGEVEESDQGEGIAFHDKTHEQQEAFMKMTVKPKMTQVFQSFDPEKFAEVKCSTCHGKGAKDHDFEMPSPDLPKMNFAKWKKKKPEMMKFMKEKVVPEMAALLGEEPYNPETQEGFGCGECHPHD